MKCKIHNYLEKSQTAANKAEYEAAFADYIHFKAIVSKTGGLADLTFEQNEYNAALGKTNLYEKLGIDNLEATNELIEAQRKNLTALTYSTMEDLETIKKGFNEKMRLAGIAADFEKFFTVINGTIIPVYEELAIRIEMFGDEIEKLSTLHPLTGEIIRDEEESNTPKLSFTRNDILKLLNQKDESLVVDV